jgi:acyl transferase domain-containing protein
MFVGVEEGDFQGRVSSDEGVSITSNHTGVLAARLAYFLNLNGPVMALNTACSSSLVAVHQACQSLRLGECDSALAGGVSLLLTAAPFIGMAQAGLLSDRGQCRAFARDADGIVPGEGVAVVVLKRLSRALADGDPIHAVIEGSGINYDGKTNGMTAPSSVAQRELIRKVLRASAMDARRIGHIVTHGTGTALGDPVEINALDEAFRDSGAEPGQCALTSIKSNLGHAFAASGVMSLIALVQSLRHQTIPATLHCEQPSDYIRWDRSPFYVNQASRAWLQPVVGSRVGAVSAFGMSGTNAHVLVSEYVPQELHRESRAFEAPYQLLVLSAKSQESLQGRVEAMIAALKGETSRADDLTVVSLSDAPLSSVAYTLLAGRHHMRYRCAIVVQNHADAIYLLEHFEAEHRPGLFKGETAREFSPRQMVRDWLSSPDRRAATLLEDPRAYREMLLSMAEFYCQGYDIPCVALHDNYLNRLHVPTYPFVQELHWPTQAAPAYVRSALTPASSTNGVLLYRPSW